MTSEKINQAIPYTYDCFNWLESRPARCSLMTCLNQKNIVRNKHANPKYSMYTELLVGSSKLLIVLDAPITKINKENAIKIGNLL